MTATLCRAARRRVRSRSSCNAHNATFAPNVVGSAWMPWVRPIITVSRWVRDSSTSTRSNSVEAPIRRSVASRNAQQPAVSTTSDDVSPKWIHDDAGGPIAACTTSTNAATSWSVIASRSSTACANASSVIGARARQSSASAAGTSPNAAWASVASSSTSSQRPNRAVSDHTASISGVEYARDHGRTVTMSTRDSRSRSAPTPTTRTGMPTSRSTTSMNRFAASGS